MDGDTGSATFGMIEAVWGVDRTTGIRSENAQEAGRDARRLAAGRGRNEAHGTRMQRVLARKLLRPKEEAGKRI